MSELILVKFTKTIKHN